MYWVGLLGIVALVVYTVVTNLYLHVSDKQCIVGIGNSVRYGMACPLLSRRLGLLSQLVLATSGQHTNLTQYGERHYKSAECLKPIYVVKV